MQVGIVGAPNQGKSTFFNASTLAGAEAANYPFTTIKANQGVGYLRIECVCKEFGVNCNPRQGSCTDGQRFVPVTLLDVAGLVPGAHQGKGLGNQFLNDLSQAAVLVHVIDASGQTNSTGEKVPPGQYDPCETVRFLEQEIDLWYLSILDKNWGKFARRVQLEKGKLSDQIAEQFSGLGVTESQVIQAISDCKLTEKDATHWSEDDLRAFATRARELAKPMIIAANKIDVEGAYENYQRMVKEFPQYTIIPTSAESELALRRAEKAGLIDYLPGDSDFKIKDESKLDEKQKRGLEVIRELLKKHGSTGVQEVLNTAVFDLLGYIAIFPGGVHKLSDSEGRVLPDVFLLPPESTPLDFAYTIHSDLGDNFICGIEVRTKKNIGKDHKLKHRDVIEIMAGK